MLVLLLRHLFESTLFSVLLILLASCLRRGAAVRHAAWLIAVLKFAIPSVLLTSTGAKIAFFWPADSWLLLAVAKISALFASIFGLLPTAASHSIFAVWVFGTATLFGLWFMRLRSNQSLLASATEQECEALTRASRLLCVDKPVPLQVSQADSEPALWGIWHFTITVPEGLYQRLTASEFEAVLLHEMAHARRRDNLTSAFAHCLVCIFWFHPLLWFAERQLRLECERACDELVIACGITPQVYIRGLLKVCRFHLFDPLPGISTMAGSDLKRRLKLIRVCRADKPIAYVFRLLVAAAAVLMLMLPIAGGYCEQCASNDTGTGSKEVRRR